MSLAVSHTPQPRQPSPNPSRRPASIAELAERALVDDVWDEHRDLKYYLRVAEKYRKDGREYAQIGDYERAFIEYARAATLVLERLPQHPEYHRLLTAQQRQNLGLNGQDILESLGQLKPTLVERYERWMKQYANGTAVEYEPPPPQASPPDTRHRSTAHETRPRTSHSHRHYPSEDGGRVRTVGPREQDLRNRDSDRENAEQVRQRSDAAYNEINARLGMRPPSALADRRREVAVQAARQAAASGRAGPEYTFSHQHSQSVGSVVPPPSIDIHRPEDVYRYQQQQQQEDVRRQEDTVRRKKKEAAESVEGIVKRQMETENANRTLRETIAINNPGTITSGMANLSLGLGSSNTAVAYQPPASLGAVYQSNGASTSTVSLVGSSSVSSHGHGSLNFPAPSVLPLENPAKYDGDSTDSESTYGASWKARERHLENGRQTIRPPTRSSSFPPPITTTSPSTEIGPIQYPALMTQHQQKQGYQPSHNSVFAANAASTGHLAIPPNMLFESSTTPTTRNLYSSELLPQPSTPTRPATFAQPPQPPAQLIQQQHTPTQAVYPPRSAPPLPVPPVPTPAPAPPPPSSSSNALARADTEPIIGSSSGSTATSKSPPGLKTVYLPRECLPRFLDIANINTALNKETCGLLLGKDRGHKYVVTTLLIPKQHSTSDTCTMDEEELVLQFTEERNLITLGWIHTHPSQSCFMSSVDLHTHSGFQRMLPESFAVVCAPKFSPNFGIFRLTDPPGLQTILDCNAKEAFHPHPDLPIYTDADKGHVQMRDASLEIVDLR